MSITVAKTAGFCFGVNRAVNLVRELIGRHCKVYTLGPIIHNPQIIEEFTRCGVQIIEEPAQAPAGSVVVIRSHGVGKQVYEQAKQAGLTVADATCPFVAKIHRIVAENSAKGCTIFIAGDVEHAEVKGIRGHCEGKSFVIKDKNELEKLGEYHKELLDMPIVMVAQTTYSIEKWHDCVEIAKKVYTNIAIFDTICSATWERQQEAKQLAEQSDMMVVIGGRQSSNTAKLFEVCRRHCPTVMVERAQELREGALEEIDPALFRAIGVTAGASTPACIIKEVQETMSEIVNNNVNETEDINFAEALEQSLKSTYTGEKVVGVVTGIAPNEVVVDIGTKHAGYVPLNELSEDPNVKPEDIVKKGDEIELIVLRVNDVEGTVMLSKKRVDAMAGLEKVYAAAEDGSILEGTVVDVVKGGVIAVTNGVRVFIPASQATASRNEPLEDLLKKNVRFKILEVNRQRKRAVGSIRAVLREERKAKEEEFWKTAEVGKVYHGEVKSLTSYGAFVDLGGVDGMIHISELSWNRIKHPSEVVNVGDNVEVYIRDLDPENHKISLGYKKNEDNPWEILKRDYPVGTVCKAKIVSMTSFGAFAEVIPGIDGLIHISQISTERINKPQDVLSVGQEVDVKITDIDFEKKRVSLSIRALLEEKKAEEEAENIAESGVEVTQE